MTFKYLTTGAHKKLAASALAGALAIGVVSESPADGHARSLSRFIGLWEAVDSNDNSTTQRSITCDEHGLCDVLGSDTFWIACAGTRGELVGQGKVQHGRLVVRDFTLTCENGRVIVLDATFTPDRRNGTLFEETSNPAISPIHFHRISQPFYLWPRW